VLRYVARIGRVLVADPRGAAERARDLIADRRERRRRPYPYDSLSNWHRSMHDLFALPWPCAVQTEFGGLWSQLVEEMATRGLAVGRSTFGGWDDAGPALALASYCLVRHLRPRQALETGVAHGVTTRFVLEALERNGSGRLASIDLPPLLATDLHREIAVAVPEGRRGRWTLCVGSSRQRLDPLLERLGSIDIFVHDSLHTERNLRYELDRAWRSLEPGGAVLLDDVDYNPGLSTFVGREPSARWVVARHDDGRRLFGILRKPPSVDQRPRPGPARSDENVFMQIARSSRTLR
jgi:hypothetical protein